MAAALSWWTVATTAEAQYFLRPASHLDPTVMRIDEAAVLGAKIDGTTQLIDHTGRSFPWSEMLGKPLILVLSYYTCDGSCSVMNQALLNLLRNVTRVEPGKDFAILTLSFDRHDTLASMGAFRRHLDLVGDRARHWTFATFERPEELERETQRLGFRFFWSPEDRFFLHPGVFLFLSPEGRLVRVLYHQDVEAHDIELAVLDAKQGQFRPSEIINLALSLCYSYSFADGRYMLSIPVLVGLGSLLVGGTTLAVAVVAYRLTKRKRSNEEGTHAQVA